VGIGPTRTSETELIADFRKQSAILFVTILREEVRTQLKQYTPRRSMPACKPTFPSEPDFWRNSSRQGRFGQSWSRVRAGEAAPWSGRSSVGSLALYRIFRYLPVFTSTPTSCVAFWLLISNVAPTGAEATRVPRSPRGCASAPSGAACAAPSPRFGEFVRG
jgi:hypothetical protein